MEPYITVTHGGSGWFAVHMEWNEELEIYEPYNTGFGRYSTKEPAVVEGKEWAKAEGMEFTDK